MDPNLKNLLFSIFGTGLAEISTLPICNVKTVYQNTSSKTISQTIKNIYNTGGIRAFYRSSLPAVSSQIFSTSTKFVGYEYLKEKYPNNSYFLNGFISGIMATLITHPIDVVKIHWQMNDSYIKEFKKVGLPLIYRGYSKTFLKISVTSPMYLPLRDSFTDYVNLNFPVWSQENKFLSALGISFVVSIVATMVVHPIDYLKTRHVYNQSLFQGYNPIKYYKGIFVNLARIVPHFTIMMTTIEMLKHYF